MHSGFAMTAFNIPNLGVGLHVTGQIVAEAIGAHHALTIIYTDDDILIAVLRLDYGCQFTNVYPDQTSLQLWLCSFEDGKPPLLIHHVWSLAKGIGPDADQVCYDLICQVREVLAQLGRAEA